MTFLFTDIEGSTRLLGQLGPDAYAEALAEHRRLLRKAFSDHGGVEVDTQGDAFFVGFPTAGGAVAAAAAGQAALAGGPIAVRIGLHTGTPTATAEGYVGVDIHRGARVAALAHGRQVLVSAATAALVDDVPFLDLGRHRLKDFDAPAQIFQLGQESFPSLRTPGVVDLPTPATHFLGRERELLEAASLWLEASPRVLTIVGPGGTGKTRLSIELARLLADDAEGGTVFVALAPVRDAALVIPLVAASLGASADTVEAIATRLGRKVAHVVLDNLEQLLPDAARQLASLIAAAPTLRLLVTSREPLRIAGEAQFDLAPMAEDDAVKLFLARAQVLRPDIVDSPAVHELIVRLDGLPLAIELAAARVKLLAPEELLDRLSQQLDLLKGGRDAEERHATLRATIAWSYDLLDDDEKRLFARLAVFRGGATMRDVESVCGADIDVLASLQDKSLVRRRTDPDGTVRFWMLETIRSFARERLDDTDDEEALRVLQIDQLTELADEAGTRAIVDEPRPWRLELVEPEIDNIRSALDWSVDSDPERGLKLATWLEAFWVVRDPTEGTTRLQVLLDECPNADPALRARALRALGGTLDILGENDRAAPLYPESLGLFVGLGDTASASHMRMRVAANMLMRGETEAAWPLLEASLDESRSLDLPLGVSQALAFLSDRSRRAGDFDEAVQMCIESADLARDVGWTWWEAGQLESAATIELERGDFDASELHATRAASLSLELGDRQHTIFAASHLAVLAVERRDLDRAGRIWGAIESEEAAGRVGQWEAHRDEVAARVVRPDEPSFVEGLAEGRLLSIAAALELETPDSA